MKIKGKYEIRALVAQRELVVRNKNLTVFFDKEQIRELDNNHLNITDPVSHDDSIYLNVKNFLIA